MAALVAPAAMSLLVSPSRNPRRGRRRWDSGRSDGRWGAGRAHHRRSRDRITWLALALRWECRAGCARRRFRAQVAPQELRQSPRAHRTDRGHCRHHRARARLAGTGRRPNPWLDERPHARRTRGCHRTHRGRDPRAAQSPRSAHPTCTVAQSVSGDRGCVRTADRSGVARHILLHLAPNAASAGLQPFAGCRQLPANDRGADRGRGDRLVGGGTARQPTRSPLEWWCAPRGWRSLVAWVCRACTSIMSRGCCPV